MRRRPSRFGVAWNRIAALWEVVARGDRQPTYHDTLTEAMEEFRMRTTRAATAGAFDPEVH